MNNISKAHQQSLEKLVNYDEGLMSKKQWLNLHFKKGSKVEITTKNKVNFDRIKFNRMDFYQQKEYENKCNQKIESYRLNLVDGSYYEITKTEYQYFLSL